jgi:hypothetical protein
MYSGKIAVPPDGGGIRLYFVLNKLSNEKVLCITRLENVLQVLALVTPRLTLCFANLACTCKMAFSNLVI